MKCIMCGKTYQNGMVVMCVRDNYRVCRNCLNKYVKIKTPIVYQNPKVQKMYETRVKKAHLQKLVDDKLWEYMR